MGPEPRRLTFIPAVDGLRAIAIVMVMLHHVEWPSRYFAGGRGGVDVFFVISGFLITSLLVNEYDRRGRIDFAEFYKRRAYRLLPALLAMLGAVVAYAVVTDVVNNGAGARSTAKAAILALLYVSNWAMAFGMHLPESMSHMWSLAIEEQFYFIAPVALAFLLPRVSRASLIRVLLAVGALGAVWRYLLVSQGASFDRVRAGLDTHADGLLIGCVVGLAFASGFAPRLFAASPAKRLAGPVTLAALALVTLLPGDMPGQGTWGVVLFSLAGLAALWSVVGQRDGLHVRFLESPIMQRIGRLSYALYLWQTPVIIYTYRALGADSPLVVRVAVSWSLTYALAETSMWLIEGPVRRLRQRSSERVPQLTYQSVGA